MELGLLASIAYLGSKNEKTTNNKDYSNSKSHKIKFTYNKVLCRQAN